jgi:hypothetical protein
MTTNYDLYVQRKKSKHSKECNTKRETKAVVIGDTNNAFRLSGHLLFGVCLDIVLSFLDLPDLGRAFRCSTASSRYIGAFLTSLRSIVCGRDYWLSGEAFLTQQEDLIFGNILVSRFCVSLRRLRLRYEIDLLWCASKGLAGDARPQKERAALDKWLCVILRNNQLSLTHVFGHPDRWQFTQQSLLLLSSCSRLQSFGDNWTVQVDVGVCASFLGWSDAYMDNAISRRTLPELKSLTLECKDLTDVVLHRILGRLATGEK